MLAEAMTGGHKGFSFFDCIRGCFNLKYIGNHLWNLYLSRYFHKMFSFIFVRHEIFSPCKHLEFCHPEPRNGIPPHRHEIKIIPHCKIARGLLKSLKAAILKYVFVARQASLPPLTRKGVRLHTPISHSDADLKTFLPPPPRPRKRASYSCHCSTHLGCHFPMTKNYRNPLLGIKPEIPKHELLMEKMWINSWNSGSWPFTTSPLQCLVTRRSNWRSMISACWEN